jgi:hypothetical protein
MTSATKNRNRKPLQEIKQGKNHGWKSYRSAERLRKFWHSVVFAVRRDTDPYRRLFRDADDSGLTGRAAKTP